MKYFLCSLSESVSVPVPNHENGTAFGFILIKEENDLLLCLAVQQYVSHRPRGYKWIKRDCFSKPVWFKSFLDIKLPDDIQHQQEISIDHANSILAEIVN